MNTHHNELTHVISEDLAAGQPKDLGASAAHFGRTEERFRVLGSQNQWARAAEVIVEAFRPGRATGLRPEPAKMKNTSKKMVPRRGPDGAPINSLR